jgi:hypothetical protein
MELPVTNSPPFSVHILAVNDPKAKRALELEASLFFEEFGNTSEQLAEEYGPYEHHGVVIYVVDNLNNTTAGLTRIIMPNDRVGLKTVNDIKKLWPELYADPEVVRTLLTGRDCWDIGTLVIAPEYQAPLAAGLVSLALYQSVARLAQRCQVDTLIALVDNIVHRMTHWKFHAPFEAIPGAMVKPYLGSKASLPVYSRISEWETRLRKVDTTLHDIIFNASGIEGAVSPLPIDSAMTIIDDVGKVVDVRELSLEEYSAIPTTDAHLVNP